MNNPSGQGLHSNSQLSYHSSRRAFTTRENEILLALGCLGQATDREIKDHLDLNDMNAVRPRISELIRDQVIEELGKIRCPVTGKSVRTVRITTQKQVSCIPVPARDVVFNDLALVLDDSGR